MEVHSFARESKAPSPTCSGGNEGGPGNLLSQDLRDVLLRFIRRHVRSHEDAEDILQEVFLRIFRNRLSLQGEQHLHAWIYKIVRNCIVDYYRGRSPVTVEEISDEVADPSPQIDDLDNEVIDCLQVMANRLPEPYRQAILMVDFQGIPQKELARFLGLSVSGVKSRVQRARAKLRRLLLGCCQFHVDARGHVFSYTHKTKSCSCP